MKRDILKIISYFLFSFCFVSCGGASHWYKGNTHTHSYWSDGDNFPEMIMDWYKSHGYDFISLSDHNTLAKGDKWKKIPKEPHHQKGFKKYLQKYGEHWVNYTTDSTGAVSVKLKTFEEYRPLFEEQGKFLIMQAEEVSDKFENKPVHMGAVNIKEHVEPQGGDSVAEVMQNNLDEVYKQRKATGQPMFAHINHPNFRWAVSVEDMLQLKGDRFFEVYNGHPHVHNYGDSSTVSMEELWDILLLHHIESGKPLVYGLATDDAHNYHEYKTGRSNPGRGWIMVRAKKLTGEALIQAMEGGDFYATTGVLLKEIEYKKSELSLQVKAEEGVDYTIQFWGGKKTKTDKEKIGLLLKEIKGTKGSYKMLEDDLYVRAKIISSKPKKNPYKEGDVETAWIQPVTGNN